MLIGRFGRGTTRGPACRPGHTMRTDSRMATLALALLLLVAAGAPASGFPSGTPAFSGCNKGVTGNADSYLYTVDGRVCDELRDFINTRVLQGRTTSMATCIQQGGNHYLEATSPEACANVSSALQERVLAEGVSGVSGTTVTCKAVSAKIAPQHLGEYEYWLAFNTCNDSLGILDQFAADAMYCDHSGTAAADGSCTCRSGEEGLGPTCSEWSNAKTCTDVGVVSIQENVTINPADNTTTTSTEFSCDCKGPATGVGRTCQYSNSNTCNNNHSGTVYKNVVDAQGGCTCDGEHAGRYCQWSNAITCSGAGQVNIDLADGSCTCAGPKTGVGASCNYTNAATCSGVGEAQYDGSCLCKSGFEGEGPTCSEYNNAKDCSSKGVVNKTGICTCTDPVFGQGPTCSEYTNNATCSNAGRANYDGTCTCFPGHAGVSCEYSDAVTCHGRGGANGSGACVCDGPATGVGPTCSEYSNNITCNGWGTVMYSNATNWVATCNCSVGRQDADCLRAGAAPFAAAHTIASMLVAVAVAAWHNA